MFIIGLSSRKMVNIFAVGFPTEVTANLIPKLNLGRLLLPDSRHGFTPGSDFHEH